MTIFEGMKQYADKAVFRGHTPGHKGKLHILDITEIDTEFPADLVEQAQQKAAKYYSSRYARFLTGGSSMGIKAAVMAVGRDLIVPENCHISVMQAAELARVNTIKLPCDIKDDLPEPVPAEKYINALKDYPDAAILAQSPDYFGRVGDRAVLELRKKGVKIIADSAHGAHFDFCGLGDLSFASSADICVMSAHKTLPCLTMGSVMTINDETLIEKTDHALRLLGTTSPSYLMLGSIEYSLDYCNEHRENYIALTQALRRFRREVKCLNNDDPTRIAVDASALGCSGVELYNYCKEKGYVAELATNRYTLFIFSITDSCKDVENLKEVISGYER